jgi:hypothetical protein
MLVHGKKAASEQGGAAYLRLAITGLQTRLLMSSALNPI